jgi:hypothetical protein
MRAMICCAPISAPTSSVLTPTLGFRWPRTVSFKEQSNRWPGFVATARRALDESQNGRDLNCAGFPDLVAKNDGLEQLNIYREHIVMYAFLGVRWTNASRSLFSLYLSHSCSFLACPLFYTLLVLITRENQPPHNPLPTVIEWLRPSNPNPSKATEHGPKKPSSPLWAYL